jgi:FlaG protein
MELGPLQAGGVDPAAQSRAARARAAQAPQGAGFEKALGSQQPDGYPPASVWQEVDHAARVAQQLHASGRQLHFSSDEASGRVVIEVRDLDGNVIRRIPPSEALKIADGGLSA